MNLITTVMKIIGLGSKTMEERIDKNTYIGIVRFTLQSMIELSKEEKEYNLFTDIVYYYEHTIKTEKILTKEEFLKLCIEVGINQEE